METALLRNAKSGVYLANSPVYFARIPQVGEYVQIGSVLWSVSIVLHAWNAQKQPLCEIRVLPPAREENLLAEESNP
jgi:hypothetical protein